MRSICTHLIEHFVEDKCASNVFIHGDRLRYFRINQETNTGLCVSELDNFFN